MRLPPSRLHRRCGTRRELLAPRRLPADLPTSLRVLLLILVCLFSLAAPGRCEWKKFTTADGLVGNSIVSIAEDRDGSFWFATPSGVSRYDGVAWTTYLSAYDQVQASARDRAGNLWFGTAFGVLRFDGSTWRRFTTADGLADNLVFTIEVDHAGALWFGTPAGASRFDGTAWRTFTASDGLAGARVYSIFADGSGLIWFGTSGGLTRFDGTSWRTFTIADGLAAASVYRVRGDASGNVWIGYEDQVGVTRFDGNSWRTFTTADGLAYNFVYSILPDRSGNVWFGTAYGGVSRFDGTRWTTFTAPNELPDNSVYSIFEDQSGYLWFGTNGGASRYDGSTWKAFTTSDGIADNLVTSILEDRSGSLWFGTYGGASRYNGSAWDTIGTADGLASQYVTSMLQDRSDRLWFGTLGGGVSRLDGTRWTNFSTNEGLANPAVEAMLEDRDGRMWFATQNGVSLFDGQTWRTFTTADGLIANDVRCMAQDRAGNLWFGTQGNSSSGGVTRFDGSTWKSYTTLDGLAFNWVQCITQDRSGSLWFGTSCCGASRYDGTFWRTYSTADGLGSNTVYSILEDRSGNLWFGTSGGVTRYDGVNWRTFTTADGLPDRDVLAILEDRTGSLWFATHGGIARYDPDRIPPRTVIVTPPPRVTSARDHALVVAAFGEVDRIEFSCRLDGAPWSPWSRNGSTFLSALPDGRHLFEARSRDFLANTDPSPAQAPFEVDGTSPSPIIESPAFGQPVRARVEVRGTVADARLSRYRLDMRPEGATSWDPPEATLLHQSTDPVVAGSLGTWETSSLPDGNYELRVSATDSLGLTGTYDVMAIVDNRPPYVEVTSPARVLAATGGDVYTTGAEIHLYFPPRAFLEDAVITVAPVHLASPPSAPGDTLPNGAVRMLPGYEIRWNPSALQKPATLDLDFTGVPSVSGVPAIYCSRDSGMTWARLGGTVDRKAARVSLTISSEGRYALFGESGASVGGPLLSSLSLTPRVFSPTGSFASRQIGIGFTLSRPAPVTLRIYNRAGRMVQEVASGQAMNAGSNLLRWDGKDRRGEFVADGIYMVTVEALGQKQRNVLAVVK